MVHLRFWRGYCLQSIPSLYAWLKAQFSNNLEDLYPASCPQTSFLVGLNLTLVPSGGWSRWRWRGPWPVLMGQTGEHHDPSPGHHNLVIDLIMIAPPQRTHTHTPLKMSLLLPQTDGYNLRHTMLQSQAENNRFHWQTLKPLIKTLQHRHMKTSNHASIFWDLQRVIWDQLLWAHSLRSSPLSSLWRNKRKKNTPKMLQLHLSTIMTPISTTTHDVFPHRFSFQKVADPRIAGPFTRMTSLAQTVPTVLNKAQACFSVGVPLLHWDSYERREWEDLCAKLVMAKKIG